MDDNLHLKRLPVLDSFMAYREGGHGADTVALFLHGNPTSSYIWRNIMPHVAPVARCIAPDLIGFGQSGKPDIEYRFADHVRYLDAFIEAAGIKSAYLVAQDWGTALAFVLAARRPELIRGLAFMEFIRPFDGWDDFHQSEAVRDAFRMFRTAGAGERAIIEENVFIERVLPGSVKREMSDAEMEAYRAPFALAQDRVPIWRLPNELPIGGEPKDVDAMLRHAHEQLASASYPKLLFAGDPGALVSPAYAESFAVKLKNCRLVQLASGAHYLQEDHPDTIGRTIADWITENAASRAA